MSGTSKITNGMICPLGGEIIIINKIIYPLKIDLISKKPKIIVSPIKKTIKINIRCREN